MNLTYSVNWDDGGVESIVASLQPNHAWLDHEIDSIRHKALA